MRYYSYTRFYITGSGTGIDALLDAASGRALDGYKVSADEYRLQNCASSGTGRTVMKI